MSLRALAAPVIAAMIGVVAGLQLSSYHVPIDMACAHGLMTAAVAFLIFARTATPSRVLEHRCDDCGFRVELTNPVAGEYALWAQVAADHPAHALHAWPSR